MQHKLTAFSIASCFAMLVSFSQSSLSYFANVKNSAGFLETLSSLTPNHFDTNVVSPANLSFLERPSQLVLEFTKQGRPIEAFYFPGKSEKRALIIAGMHGSELSSIAIARNLINQLQQDTSHYYNVLVLPILFPDNAATAMQEASEIGTVNNIGRYSNENLPDPNRQMPALGKSFDVNNPVDYVGRTIEKENQLMLQVIQSFKPDRILNIHAIKDIKKAGIFADPRTDAEGRSLGFDSDSSLAVTMATAIEQNGGCVLGNQLVKLPTAMYHSDFRAVQPGFFQKRNLAGSQLPNKRGFGVSLGAWATTAVAEGTNKRNAIRLLTMEFPGCKRPEDYKEAEQKLWCQQELDRYTASIKNVFLANYYEE